MKENMLRPDERTQAILTAAWGAYRQGETLRRARERYKQFTYGDQWSDMTVNDEGRACSERQAAMERGRRPMTNNLIRRLVRCVVGHYRRQVEEENNNRSDAVERIAYENSLEEIDARTLEEFLISGCAVQRVTACHRPGRGEGVWIDMVSPERLIINRVSDPRGWDIELVGMLHDMSLGEIIMRYGGGVSGRVERLREIYGPKTLTMGEQVGMTVTRPDFFRGDEGRCRVIEVWTLEAQRRLRVHDPENATLLSVEATDEAMAYLERENNERTRRGVRLKSWRDEVVSRWHGRWIAPDGTLLKERLAAMHPFVVKLYPLTDGEVHSLVEDVIDQQIYINRLITLTDHVVGASAKGALLFPTLQKLPSVTWQEIGRRWAAPDGVIPITGKGNSEPRQVAGNGADGGARELLQLQMKMFEEVSGVTNALMGRPSGGGNVGAERYEAEVKHGTTAILDLLKSYRHFTDMRDKLIEHTSRLVKLR